jgi:hypothetical protein
MAAMAGNRRDYLYTGHSTCRGERAGTSTLIPGGHHLRLECATRERSSRCQQLSWAQTRPLRHSPI